MFCWGGGGRGALALKCTKGGKKGKGNKEEGVEERKGGLLCLSQDGSSDRSGQKMGHLSSILCSHKQHI